MQLEKQQDHGLQNKAAHGRQRKSCAHARSLVPFLAERSIKENQTAVHAAGNM
jgi:hypothetical protein